MRGHSALFQGRVLRACRDCQMRFAHPMPSNVELAAYNAAYFENAHGGAAAAEAAAVFHRAINRVRVNHVERARAASGVEVRRVLEVGPGLGDFAARWRDLHPGSTYHAIESDARQREVVTRLGVATVATEQELPRGEPFDLLVLSHVLEHTSDPAGFLNAFRKRLRRGALVFIEVPCRDDLHKASDEPHLLFFDKPAMRRLLPRAQLREVRVSYHGLSLDHLTRKSRVRTGLRRLRDGVLRVADRLHLVPVPTPLRGVGDAAARAAVRALDGHRELGQPGWWLRVIAVADGDSTA